MILEFVLSGIGIYSIYRINNIDKIRERKIKRAIKDTWDELNKNVLLHDYSISKITPNNVGATITIDVPVGGTFTELETKKECFEKAFKGKAILTDIPNSNKVELNLITIDIDGITQPVGNDPLILPVGFNPFGEHLEIDMHRNAGLLINGVPGVGKSVLIKQLNDYVIRNGAKCYYIQLAKSDLKGLGVNVADNIEDILALTESLLELINSCSNKEVIYLFIDEFSFLTPFKGDKDKLKKEQIINNISLILRICRSEYVRVILSTQKVISDFLPTTISSILEAKLTFKCGDVTSSTMVIGDGSATKLRFREFIINDSEGLRQGKTYKLDL